MKYICDLFENNFILLKLLFDELSKRETNFRAPRLIVYQISKFVTSYNYAIMKDYFKLLDGRKYDCINYSQKDFDENIKKIIVENNSPYFCYTVTKYTPEYFQFVKTKNMEISKEAIMKNPYLLEYVDDQTYDLCLFAIKLDGKAIKYVKNQTKELCMLAIKNGATESCIRMENKDDDIYFELFKYDRIYYPSINKDLSRLVDKMLKYDVKKTIKYFDHCYYDKSKIPKYIIMEIVKYDYTFLDKIEQTDEICLQAVKANGEALKHVKNKTPKIIAEALKNNYGNIIYADDISLGEVSSFINKKYLDL